MKVILNERVAGLGNVGEIINVTNGHARNYLFPNKLAVLADENNKKQLEDQKIRLAKKVEEERKNALALKKKVDGVSLEIERKVAGNGKLFGTVTNSELAKLLEGKGITVERRLITIEEPIKALGQFQVKVKLFSEVDGVFKVKVVMDAKQVEEMKKKEEAAIAKKKKAKEAKVEEDSEESTETPEGEAE